MSQIDFGNMDFDGTQFESVNVDDTNAKFFHFDDIDSPEFDIEKLFESDEKAEEKALNDNDATLQKLQEQSEGDYIQIANNIVKTSVKQLNSQNLSKAVLKKMFTKFFTRFISIQYLALILIFAAHMFLDVNIIPSEILIAYISSIFVETLGAILLMIKYAFDSSQETQVLAILNSVISNYQKFKGSFKKSADKNTKKNIK